MRTLISLADKTTHLHVGLTGAEDDPTRQVDDIKSNKITQHPRRRSTACHHINQLRHPRLPLSRYHANNMKHRRNHTQKTHDSETTDDGRRKVTTLQLGSFILCYPCKHVVIRGRGSVCDGILDGEL